MTLDEVFVDDEVDGDAPDLFWGSLVKGSIYGAANRHRPLKHVFYGGGAGAIELMRGSSWTVIHTSPTRRGHFVERSLPVTWSERRELDALPRDEATVRKLFDEYATTWLAETAFYSDLHAIVLHQDYQRIVGLGPAAVSLIIERLRVELGHWFWALSSIVGSDVAEGTETLAEARDRWLAWYDSVFDDVDAP